MRKQAEAWLSASYYDLLVIEEILSNHNLTHMVAFHAQQAIEKSLKAIIEFKDKKIPKTHNLIVLNEIANKLISSNLDPDLIIQLNDIYIDTRYPTDIGLLPEGKPDQETAKIFYNFAKEVYTSIKKNIAEK
ncbi:MAG: HEPN domain-containing protein [Cyclobacteriaceae bacterium]